MVRWCIWLIRLTPIREVIGYRLVQVWQKSWKKSKKSVCSWKTKWWSCRNTKDGVESCKTQPHSDQVSTSKSQNKTSKSCWKRCTFTYHRYTPEYSRRLFAGNLPYSDSRVEWWPGNYHINWEKQKKTKYFYWYIQRRQTLTRQRYWWFVHRSRVNEEHCEISSKYTERKWWSFVLQCAFWNRVTWSSGVPELNVWCCILLFLSTLGCTMEHGNAVRALGMCKCHKTVHLSFGQSVTDGLIEIVCVLLWARTQHFCFRFSCHLRRRCEGVVRNDFHHISEEQASFSQNFSLLHRGLTVRAIPHVNCLPQSEKKKKLKRMRNVCNWYTWTTTTRIGNHTHHCIWRCIHCFFDALSVNERTSTS